MSDFKQQIQIQNEANRRMILSELINQRDRLDKQIEEAMKHVNSQQGSDESKRGRKKKDS